MRSARCFDPNTSDDDDNILFYSGKKKRGKGKGKSVFRPSVDRASTVTFFEDKMFSTLDLIKEVYSACYLSNPGYTRENIDMNTNISIGSPVMIKV
jgi:hypothetical protein